MKSFYTDVIRKDKRFASTSRINDLSLLEPGTRAAVAALITDSHSRGFDVVPLETYRSSARQQQLFKQGATKLQNVGCHGYGVACDLGHIVNGKLDPVGEHYAIFQALCLKHGLISGIDWGQPNVPHSFRDWDHVQRVPLFRQNAMFAGTWYPAVDYDPWADMKSLVASPKKK